MVKIKKDFQVCLKLNEKAICNKLFWHLKKRAFINSFIKTNKKLYLFVLEKWFTCKKKKKRNQNQKTKTNHISVEKNS